MSINLKPHSLECGRSFKVLDFGSQENAMHFLCRKFRIKKEFSCIQKTKTNHTQGFLDISHTFQKIRVKSSSNYSKRQKFFPKNFCFS